MPRVCGTGGLVGPTNQAEEAFMDSGRKSLQLSLFDLSTIDIGAGQVLMGGCSAACSAVSIN